MSLHSMDWSGRGKEGAGVVGRAETFGSKLTFQRVDDLAALDVPYLHAFIRLKRVEMRICDGI